MILTCDMDLGSDLDLDGRACHVTYGACGEGVVACDTASVIENTRYRENLRLSDGVVINGQPIEAPAYNPNCGSGALRRSFRDCGGGTQWLIILPIDPFDNTAIVWPEDEVVDCDAYDNGEPGWPETTCNLVGVSLESDTFMFDGNSCMKILNHWTIIDWCLYDPTDPNSFGKYTHTQVVKIIDTMDPVVSVQDSVCYAVLNDCQSSGVILSAMGVDNGDCGTRWLRWELSVDAYADWTEDYFYSTNNPKYLSNGQPNPYHIDRSGNNVDVSVELPDGIPASNIWHRAIWRAYDGCGNTSSEMVYFQIADKKAPTPYCLNLSTAVMENGEVELWAVDLDQGSFDNCTNNESLLFTFTNTAPPPRKDDEYDSNADLQWYNGNFWYYNSEERDASTGFGEYEKQDDYGGEIHRWEPGLRSSGKIFTIDDADSDGFVEVPIYVWDENGNVDYCLVTLRLVDNGGGGMAMVSGKVVTEFGEAVENITTELDGPLNYHLDDITDREGVYAFPNTPQFADYELKGHKNDDYLNGVSTLDLIVIQRHILGLENLDSPYKMIAADINNDRGITAIDLIELRKLILGIYSALPANGSWKLIDASMSLSLNNPWDYKENISIQALVDDKMNEDFVGVKVGDVNNSVVTNAKGTDPIEKRGQEFAELKYKDRVLKGGQINEVDLFLDQEDISGMQFELIFSKAELISFTKKTAWEGMHVLDGNSLKLSCNKIGRHDVESALFVVELKPEVDISLSEVVSLEDDQIRSEAYNTKLEVKPLMVTAMEDGQFAQLMQNKPNPFSFETTIEFYIPRESQITLEFTDINGRLIKKIEGFYRGGNHAIKLDKSEFQSSGLVQYSLVVGEEKIHKTMVVIP